MTSNPPLPNVATTLAERRPAVFISYARADAAFAQRLITDLRAAGHACWIDTSEIKGGVQWANTIAEAIDNSSALVVIVTRQALRSEWVRKEIIWAQNAKKLIIPLLLQDVIHEPGFILLVDCHGIPFFNHDHDYDAALGKLLRALPSPALPNNAPRALELDYLERLKQEELLDAEKYTPMGGGSRQKRSASMRPVFKLGAIGKDKLLQESRRFDDAVAEIRRIRRAVLLGDPGGGKTTTVWKLAADLVETALTDPEAPIPLLIPLGLWTEAGQTLPEFIASQLAGLGGYLDVLLAEKRAALLLDGLNELPAGQRAAKYPLVRQFIEQHPQLLAVVSCREQDYTPNYDFDLGFDRITIIPLDPIRIREFAGNYLGAEQGEALFWKLAGERARGYFNDFIEKAGSEHEAIFWLADHLPDNLKWTYDWDQERTHSPYWKNWIQLRETPSSLMVLARNPYMLWMLTSVYDKRGELPENRGDLFREFVEELLEREEIPAAEQSPLTDGLAQVAYEMQIHRANDDQGNALTAMPKEDARKLLGERRLYLAGSASILSLGEQARFTHQLLQEYFAARYMQIKMSAGQFDASTLWPPDRWWERTNWEEAAILLAGLYSDDCSPVVEWIAEANPEVAAMCATRGGAGLADATRERLRTQWIPRLTGLERDPNPRARAAAGRALGLIERDNRKGVEIVRDASGVALPDIDWVEIPGGEFQYGHKDEDDNPPQKLTLPTFHISRYPVTYVQFKTFLDDPEGYLSPRWFEGLAAGDDDRRMDEQWFKFINHPRETVNWYQAMAFCRWLSWRLGGKYDLKKVEEWAVRLPTEFEWEKAARGVDGRLYPYKGDYDAAKGNVHETGIGQTSAVGIFPNGASPYGVMDMSGNVWEWCLSNYDKPAFDARKENVRTEKSRVLRGGAWFDLLIYARAVFRYINRPAVRDYNVGFRVVSCVRPPSLLL